MVGGGHVSLHAAKHLDPVVALALGHSVHEEPDAADEGRTLGADGGAQRCVARAVQRTAHTQMCSVNREDCDERGRQPVEKSVSTLGARGAVSAREAKVLQREKRRYGCKDGNHSVSHPN